MPNKCINNQQEERKMKFTSLKLLIPFFIIIFYGMLLAHDTPVHQYVVKQAYYFLENEIGTVPELRDRIGLSFNGAGNDATPWATGYIGVAAMREDLEDPIWGFGGLFDGWTPSVTHFWDADNGDNVTTPIPASPDAYNAFYKAKVYLFGGHNVFLQVPETNWDLGGPILGYIFSYDSVIELYKTGRCYIEGYVDIAGDSHTWEPEETYMDPEGAKEIAAQIIGRVAHLLTDMSVPAHVHNDLHPPPSDSDEYEDWMSQHYLDGYYELPHIDPIYWDAWNAARQGPLLDVYQAVPTHIWEKQIRYLFYTTNQIADRFPSDDANGDNNYTTSYNGDDYSVLNLINEIDHSYNSGSVQPFQVNQYAFRYGIRAVAGLLYWFAVETDMLPRPTPISSATVSPTTNNVGSVKADTYVSGSFVITNTGGTTLNLTIQSSTAFDLDPSNSISHEPIIYRTINPGSSITVNYDGYMGGSVDYGPFTKTITINDNSNNIQKTHTVVGTLLLPDFCESQARASSPEEFIFDKAFIDYYAISNDSLNIDKSKSIKERLGFAYKLLKQPKYEKIENICKMIISLYPESEMGISFYAMGLLWEAAYSDEDAPDFTEKEFKKYLKKLTNQKDKYKINGYAQLILSLLDEGNDIEGLEKLFSDYEYDILKELALFHQFIHYYIHKNDEVTARNISDKLDEIFIVSQYGYEAHLILGDDGYTLEGLQELLKKKQGKSLAKRSENKNDILSEMPNEYKLYNNYPNPFNPTTTIKYSVPKNSDVKLRVYNMMGQLIKTLVNESKAPGFYYIEWNGTNENDSKVASGIYFYRFESGNFVENNKMILIK